MKKELYYLDLRGRTLQGVEKKQHFVLRNLKNYSPYIFCLNVRGRDGWDSAVGIGTRCGMDGSGIESRLG